MSKQAQPQHTQEPWIARAISSGAIEIVSEREEHIYEVIAYPASEIYGSSSRQGSKEANARRIVACVNALVGISTENLEKSNIPYMAVVREIAGAQNHIRELRQQRDRLLLAAQAFFPNPFYPDDFEPSIEDITNLRAAVNEVVAANPSIQFHCFSDAINAVKAARDVTELCRVSEKLDAGFLSGGIQVTDQQWQEFTSACAARQMFLEGK